MAGHKKCKYDGCLKSGQFFGYCAAHFHWVYGITYAEYTSNRREIGEDPQVVALRLRNKDEADRIKRGQDAKETFDQAMREEKEKKEKKAKKESTNWEERPEEERQRVAGSAGLPVLGGLRIFLDSDLLLVLAKMAKAEFRTPDMQAAYILDKELRSASQNKIEG